MGEQLKLSLFSRGLLLVTVPICIQVGFICSFIYLQNQAEHETAAAEKARLLAEKFNDTGKSLYDLYNLMEETRVGDRFKLLKLFSSRYQTGFRPVFQKLLEEHAALAELTGENPQLHAKVKRSEASIKTISDIMDQAYRDMQAGNVGDPVEYGNTRVRMLDAPFQHLLADEFAADEKAQRNNERESTENEHRTWHFITVLMLITFLANTVFCLALAFYFFKGIVSRLSVLKQNAVNMAADKRLRAPLDGDDEIAEVDHSFHNMAKKLEEAARARQELVNMLTHDLRTPLTAIRGSLDILASGKSGELSKANKDLVTMAQRNSKRMLTLITDLLDIEKIKSGMLTIEPHKISLQDLLDDAANEIKPWLSAENKSIEVNCDDIYVYGDEEKLARVLQNLLSNAVKASRPGDKIILSARPSGAYAEVSVRDHGRGIAVEELSSIFDRFKQNEKDSSNNSSSDSRASAGSGLGLTIARALVELHGGKIRVESRLNEGTVFYFTIPLK